jgi:hypothetical protein
MDKIEALEK